MLQNELSVVYGEREKRRRKTVKEKERRVGTERKK